MGNTNNNSLQFNDQSEDFEDDEWEDDSEEDSIHARKEHQNHRGRTKGDVRRHIEDLKEQQQLKSL